jgi:thiol-disulfide isomerase/thioredoxin
MRSNASFEGIQKPRARRGVFALMLVFVAALACNRKEQPVPATTTAATNTAGKPAPEAPEQVSGLDVGATFPKYEAMYLDGTKFDLASTRDKVVMLNVWATWCGPCREEIPELQLLHDRYKDKGFEVIGVSVDDVAVDVVKSFAEEKKMTYPVVIDAKGEIANMLQTSVLPSTVLLDRQGRIVWKRFAIILPNDKEVIAAIEKAL